ncbi:hypothetical protein MKK68_01660, partial [Methylobacterium sp. E-016]|uniref:hypothetical protein n=1 Tax=Methylobacterium sp. E-016 TaxID=2836556 RepID=UPI001FBBC740
AAEADVESDAAPSAANRAAAMMDERKMVLLACRQKRQPSPVGRPENGRTKLKLVSIRSIVDP